MLKLGEGYIKYAIIKIEKLEERPDGMQINYYGKLIMKKGVVILLNYILN